MSWLSSFMHPGRGYERAEDEMRKYYDEAKGFQLPFLEYGQKASGNLFDALNKLMNPGQLQSEWAKGYETSPYAESLMRESKGLGLDAASSMGLMGSSAGLENIQRGASDIVAKDRENYMNNLMQKYLSGVGIAQGLFGTGANAASGLSQGAMNMGQTMGGLEFGRNQAGGNMLSQILGTMGGSALGGFSENFGKGLSDYLTGKMGWKS